MNNRYISRLGWPLILLLIAIPIVIWFCMMPLSDRFSNPYLTLTSIGRWSGIFAAVLFCYNILLSSRLRILEQLFGGLNKMYIAHHLIGGIAICVILVHPLMFSLRATMVSLHDAANQLIPFVTTLSNTFGILALWLFIVLIGLTFYIKLPYKIWLFTHKFMGLVLIGIILHVILGSPDVTANVYLRDYMWGLFIVTSLAFLYRSIFPGLLIRRYKYVIQSVTQPAKGVVRITMMPKRRRLEFVSGQFIFVSFRTEGFSHEFHPFSISSNSAEEGLSITVKALGKYTGTLAKLAPGMAGMDVWIEGAYGKFSFRNFTASRQIWVAGGIGITPFLSMAPDVKAGYQVDLYYSVKSFDEMIDWPHLDQLAHQSEGAVRVIPFITDRDGFLSGKRIAEISGDLSKADVLMCGPPPMMHALTDQLKSLGVAKKHIHSEEFSMS
jgi:predicted ferric reductase